MGGVFMRTKLEEYQVVVNLRNQLQDDDEFIRKVVSTIALNDLDKNNPQLATILDFAIEYTDDSTLEDRKKKLRDAVLAIVDAL